MLTILPIVGLVGASNLSTAIIILGIGAVMIFTASPKYLQFFWMIAGGAGFMTIFLALESYRLERIATGEIRRNTKKVIRPCRDCMPLEAEAYLAEDWGTVSRSWGFFLRHKMI